MNRKEITEKINDIISRSNSINVINVADEVLTWIKDNVTNFIDNKTKRFKLDLTVKVEDESNTTLGEVYKLQNLYQELPEDPDGNSGADAKKTGYDSLSEDDKFLVDEIIRGRAHLDTITKKCHEAMRESSLRKDLFDAMIYFYELKGAQHGKLLTQKLEGGVDINLFEYDSFPVHVKVTQKTFDEDAEGNVVEKRLDDSAEEYVIPEGFAVWLEISYKPKSVTASLF